MSSNRAKDILCELGLAHEDSLEPYYPTVRDRADVGVLIDTRSGVILLDRTDHMDVSHYEGVDTASYWGGKTRAEALANYREDDERRSAQWAHLFSGKDVVDVGCGTGGFLDLVRPLAKSVSGVEPQAYMRDELTRLGHTVFRLPEDAPAASFDVAFLFHTLEHVVEPLEVLREVKRILRPGGVLVVEVPHAKDALLDLGAFKKFSLWSEHLILNTKESLEVFLRHAGFVEVVVEGFQRYPLANHAGWLIQSLPGGHKKLADMTDPSFAALYEAHLKKAGRTDTLIAIAHV